MKSISEKIVENIDVLNSQCSGLIEEAHNIDTHSDIIITP